jgi:hypothetical protein
MVVQNNLEYLRDQFDGQTTKLKQGSATVPNGATTVNVTHSLGIATNYVALTPTVDPGGRYWVTGKSATAFTINLQVAAPVAGISFDWIVKGA